MHVHTFATLLEVWVLLLYLCCSLQHAGEKAPHKLTYVYLRCKSLYVAPDTGSMLSGCRLLTAFDRGVLCLG